MSKTRRSTAPWVLLAVGAWLFTACSDSGQAGTDGAATGDGSAGPVVDGGGGSSDGPPGGSADGGGGPRDGAARDGAARDASGPRPDGGVKPGDSGSGRKDTGGGGTKDSGNTTGYKVTFCNLGGACGADETCLVPGWDQKKGVCTKKCSGNPACASADRVKFGLSQMCVSGSVTRPGTGTTTYSACAYLCKDEFGKTYNCPSGTNCWAVNPMQSMCIPPQ
ncbi:MAG: hypothetical protein IT371_08240 [Deltaproteobacteria bacterium]|nr:hypothetical protein [Deltaproteobacteria bacterium]